MKIIFIDRCLNMCFGELLTWEMYYLTDVQSRAVFVKEIFVTQSRITRHWIGERMSINFLLWNYASNYRSVSSLWKGNWRWSHNPCRYRRILRLSVSEIDVCPCFDDQWTWCCIRYNRYILLVHWRLCGSSSRECNSDWAVAWAKGGNIATNYGVTLRISGQTHNVRSSRPCPLVQVYHNKIYQHQEFLFIWCLSTLC
mgnify:CR=1 FL=1